LAHAVVDVSHERLDILAFVGRLVVTQVRVLPQIHDEDRLAPGELVDVVVTDPYVDELIGRCIVKGNCPTNAAHAADSGKVLLPCLDRTKACNSALVQTSACGHLFWTLGQIIKVELMQPHPVEFPTESAYELRVGRIRAGTFA